MHAHWCLDLVDSDLVLFAQLTLDTHNDIDNKINGKNDVFEKVIVIVINNTGNDLSSAASSPLVSDTGPRAVPRSTRKTDPDI